MQKQNINRSRKLRIIDKKHDLPSVTTILEQQNMKTSEMDEYTFHEGSPTPLDFDRFLPWVCMQWCMLETVTVVPICTENEHAELFESKNVIQEQNKSLRHQTNLLDLSQLKLDDNMKNIRIEANYNAKHQLEAISIDGCLDLPKKIIQAISFCPPFHPALNRLNIRKGRLSQQLINEICKFIPRSNITTICLDDSAVPQGVYYMLSQETCQLTHLSMNRCKINDEICKEIAINLALEKPAAQCLNILELASNNITDAGAQFLGVMLQTNRHLLHLNLAGNKITDDGAKALFKPLMEFCITHEEVIDMKRRRFIFLQKRQAIFNKFLKQELKELDTESSDAPSQAPSYAPSHAQSRSNSQSTDIKLVGSKKSIVSIMSPHSNRTSKAVPAPPPVQSPRERAQMMTDINVGEYIDPYSPANVECRNKHYFCKGNLILCSLNLAYNSLHYPSIKLLNNVLSYQHRITKFPPATGLIRIVINGNYIPECAELRLIEFYLGFKVAQNVAVRPVADKTRKLSSSSRRLRRPKSVMKDLNDLTDENPTDLKSG